MNRKEINEAGTLLVACDGEFSLDEAKGIFLRILRSATEADTVRILFDGTSVTGEPSTMERFYYGQFVAEEVRKLVTATNPRTIPRFAYVLKEPLLDPRRLGETVAMNRGMHVRMFDDYDSALKWLEEER